MSLYVDHYLQSRQTQEKDELDRRIAIQGTALDDFEGACHVWMGQDFWNEATSEPATGEWHDKGDFYMTKRFTWGAVAGNIDMLHGDPGTALLALSAGGHKRLVNLPIEDTNADLLDPNPNTPFWMATPLNPEKLGEALYLAQRDAEAGMLKAIEEAEKKKREQIRELERRLETAGSQERALEIYNKLVADHPERMIAFYNLLTATQDRLRKEAAEKAARAKEREERRAEQARLEELARCMFEPFTVYRVAYLGLIDGEFDKCVFYSQTAEPDDDGWWTRIDGENHRAKPSQLIGIDEIKVTELADAWDFCRHGYLVSRKFEDIRVAYAIPLSDPNPEKAQELEA